MVYSCIFTTVKETKNNLKLEIMTTYNNYTKGLTLTAAELKALDQALETRIHNRLMGGCNAETHKILRGIKKRLEEAKQ